MTLSPYATIIAHIDGLAICEDGFGDLLYAEIPESCAELGTAIKTEILHAITELPESKQDEILRQIDSMAASDGGI